MNFHDATGVRVDDRDYFDIVLASVEEARVRVWASLFIYDPRPARDVAGQVHELTMALVDRARRGIDVRVLLTGQVATPDIAVANLTSGLLFDGYRIPHRRLFETGDGRAGSHAKFVVIDEVAIVGSQNWTDDAFRLNIEDAVMVSGSPVTLLAQEFAGLWDRGKGMPRRDDDA